MSEIAHVILKMDTFQTALITGGNGNLGRLVAQQLSAKGIDVLCLDLPETEQKNETFYKNIFLGDVCDQDLVNSCLLYTSPSPRDATLSRMPSSA